MVDRLSFLDVSFLHLEGPQTPMHVGGLAIFAQPPRGFDYERLYGLIEKRISLVPRFRQKVKWVPGHLAAPVWVDDADFDLSYHLRRSALPRPGADDQLRELVARVQSRSLDRHRPLWEMYLVEGLADGRFAIISKTHHAMVDGIRAVDLSQVLLDVSPRVRELPEQEWRPRPEPSGTALVVEAISELGRRPPAILDTLRLGVADLRTVGARVNGVVAGAVGEVASAALAASRPAPSSPLNAATSAQRRFATVSTDLEDYRVVRERLGGTVNDVVLATVAGAVRGWLLSRGEPVRPSSVIRAMLPVGVRSHAEAVDARADAGSPAELAFAGSGSANGISSYLIDLPVGEANPVVRFSQVSYAMRAHEEAGRSVGAEALAALSEIAPPTMHAMAARLASSLAKRLFNLVITNVPGPQLPLYCGGARLLETYPVTPLSSGQALAIGLTSYDGGVYFGLNGDREAMYDVTVLAALISEALAELVEASSASGLRGARPS
jgi:diacylglycerol O-acyltransferase